MPIISPSIITPIKKYGIGMSAGEAAIRAGNTVAWYDYTDLTTITKDGSNYVSKWADKLGSGRDLEQVTGAKQPEYKSTGIYFAGGGGRDAWIKTATFTLNQPVFIYLVVKQVSWTVTEMIFDGWQNNFCKLQQYTASPGLRLYGGASLATNNDLAVGVYGILRILFSGASSKLQVGLNAALSGNAGTSAMSGLTLGASADGASGHSNVEFKEVILRNVADNATTQTNIYNYLKAKYSL